MDEIDNNKHKTIFGKFKSSISDIFPAALSKTGATSSFSQPDCEVDIDSVEEESSNHDDNNFKVNREFRKLENQRNLKRKLADLKSKNQYNDEFSLRPKFPNHNTSIRDDVVINESLSNTVGQEGFKLKTNYRTLCDFEIRKPVDCVLSSHNPLNNNSGCFLSMSRQSLNDSVNETGISSTASRIAANILNKTNSQKTGGIIHKTSSNSSCNSFSMRTRRYRTIIKQDKFSSYLTRVPKDDNLFNAPNFGSSNVILNLNCSEDSTKRVDFSYAHVIQDQQNTAKESIDSNIYWICVNCNSSNPWNFNFCPTCSTSNPKSVLKEKNFQPKIDDNKNIWLCSRCSTKNDECRIVCVFCFKNRNISAKKPKFDVNNDEERLNSKMSATQKFNFADSVKMDFNFDSTSETSNAVKSTDSDSCNSQLLQRKSIFGSSSFPTEDRKTASYFGEEGISERNNKEGAKEKSKWNCPVCLAENESERGQCACCAAGNPNKPAVQHSKSDFLFGSSNLSTENSAIKFGSSGIVLDKPISSFVFGESPPPTEFVFGKRDLAGLAGGTKWSCSECWVENEPERERCARCSSRRPISATASDADKSAVRFRSTKNDPAAQLQSVLFGAAGLPGKAASLDQSGAASKKWSCSECWVENGADKEKCVCCAARNPAAQEKDSSTPKIQFGSIATSVAKQPTAASEKGSCPFCLAKSEAEREECACRNPLATNSGPAAPLGSSRPAPVPTFVFNGSNSTANRPQASPIKFGNNWSSGTELSLQNGTAKNPPAKWGCPTCLVENADSAACCACCQARNPGRAAQVPIFDRHKEPSQPAFKFGCAEGALNPKVIDARNRTENGPVAQSSNLLDTDCLLEFIFSPPLSLPVTASTQVPVDLEFAFSAPQSI